MTQSFKYIRNNSVNRYWLLLLLAGSLMMTTGCKKFADVPPPNSQLVSSTVFNNDNTVLSALSGMYISMYISRNQTFQIDLSMCPENSADETHYYTSNTTYDPYNLDNIPIADATVQNIWTDLYAVNYQANAIITGVQSNASLLSDSIKNQALGEAKFIRAFCQFYLVNLFGDVPLILTTDALSNTNASRASADNVYAQIIADLLDAQSKLKEDYSTSSTKSRIRPNKYAATALLARVYLYRKQWSDAETQATAVINKTGQYSLLSTANMGNAFLLNNTEAIFQMNGANNSNNVYYGYNNYAWQYLYAVKYTQTPYMVFDSTLVKAFEPGDQRFVNWVSSINYAGTTYYFPYKYKQQTVTTTAAAEAYTYLRLAEQYLIRAEARAEQGNLTGAAADVNMIRNRAGLGNTTAATQSDLLQAVLQERRVELFCEFGHRWYDLKRTGRADSVLSAIKPTWKSSAVLYPIPQLERDNDINLTQNTGY